ncbi:MAG TPA: uroporphyrinogen-III C-methyltransferase [Clostridia bacterium]|nr:uroporphyrinogen-III C-methyltransferase [Clostridia bacterium]
MNRGKGYVYLVGAGPGDPGLLTLKGREAIAKADVIVYDRLVHPAILEHAGPAAELIYVGKSPERHTLKQEEINELLKDKALEGKVVTRVKGGDPFVFGRGGEEAEVLAEHGIPFEIVPGITSAVAVPAYAGIPVTHRDCTSTIGIITGNEDPAKEESSIDWAKLATGLGTLVFLMGMANLPKIVDRLLAHGRDGSTPVALIRWGTRPEQETLTGTLADIVEKARAANFSNPAIIIVGEVVKLREKLMWFEKQPLFGRRVVVTRAREQASALSSALKELGAAVMECPTIEIESPLDWAPVDAAIHALEGYQWVIFTSVNGVKSFFQRLLSLGYDVRKLYGIKICAIGPKTREALEKYALRVEYMPEEYVAEAIIEGLKDKIRPGEKVLLPRADIARKVLAEALRELGGQVTEVTVYRTVKSTRGREALLEALRDKKVDIVTFTSSSTVRNFVELLPPEERERLLEGVKLVSIGPITTKTAEDLGLRVDVTAREYTVNGLVQAIVANFAGGPPA